LKKLLLKLNFSYGSKPFLKIAVEKKTIILSENIE